MHTIPATVIHFKEVLEGGINVIYCDVELPDECGGGVRSRYKYLCPEYALMKPYIGLPVICSVSKDFGICVPTWCDFAKLKNMNPGDIQIGNDIDNVTIRFTKDTIDIGLNTVKNVSVSAQNVTVNTQKAVVNAVETEINGQNIALNVTEITSTANITTSGNITGALVTGSVDVQSGSISLKNHKHISGNSGTPTGPAMP